MTRQPRGLWATAAVVLAAHAALLAHVPVPPAGAARGAPAPSFHTRWIAWPAAPQDVAGAAGPPPPAGPASQAQGPAPHPAPKAGATEPAAAAAPQSPRSGAPAPAPSSRWTGLDPGGDAAREAPWLPRGQLTVPPRPQGLIDVPFPADAEGVVNLRVRLLLFIDENGVVQRVQLDSPDVPPAFARAAVSYFLATRFLPGEREGVRVRSQAKLEVEFQAPGSSLPEAGALSKDLAGRSSVGLPR